MELIKKEYHKVGKQFIRFVIIGFVSSIFYYLVYATLYIFFQFHYLISATIGYILGVGLGFILNFQYSFSTQRKIHRTMINYFSVYFVSLIINLILLRIMVENLFMDPLISDLILLPIIGLMNFFGIKFIAFGDRSH